MKLFGGKGPLCITASVFLLVPILAGCRGQSSLQPGTPASDNSLQKGQTLYRANCQTCHGGRSGGNLRDIPPPHNANGHTWHHPDQVLQEIVLIGLAPPVARQTMPAFKDKLTQADIQAIFDYVKTWWTDQQRQWQATVTAEYEKKDESP